LELLNCAAGGSNQPVDPALGLNYIRSYGIVLESDYPYSYSDFDGVCDVTTPPSYFIDNYNKVNISSQPLETRVETIKNRLMSDGPLIVYFEKPGGYYCTDPNHDYGTNPLIEKEYWALVGWQDDPEIINGGYWIVRFTYSPARGYCQVRYGFSHIDDVYYSINYSGSLPSNLYPCFTKYYEEVTAIYNNTLSLQYNAVDPDGDPVTYSIANKPVNATFNTSTGLFEWIPGRTETGTYNITVTATDGSKSVSQKTKIIVKSNPPVFNHIYNRLEIPCGTSLELDLGATDIDGDPLTYSITTVPSGLQYDFDKSTGLLKAIAQNNWLSLIIEVSDAENTISQRITFSIQPTNLSFNVYYDIIGMLINEEIELDLSAIDPSGLDITYYLFNQPKDASFDSTTALFRYTPLNVGKVVFTEEAHSKCATRTRVITIEVLGENYPPTIVNLQPEYRGNEGSLIALQIEATDPNYDSLTYFGVNLPTGASIDEETGLFSWIPNFFQSGSHTVTFGVSDGEFQDTAETVLTIGNVNGPPSFKNLIPEYSGREGTLIDLDFSAIEPDNEPVAYSVTSLPPGASLNPSTGQFLWTPSYTSSGEYGMTIYATDGKRTVSQFVHLTIVNVKSIKK
jgi:hypothetical protein